MTTSPDLEPYGAQLYAEFRKRDIVVGKLSCDAIQRLKSADRRQTLQLFRRCSDLFLQQIKTQEPAAVAAYLVQEAHRAQADSGVIILMMSNLSSF